MTQSMNWASPHYLPVGRSGRVGHLWTAVDWPGECLALPSAADRTRGNSSLLAAASPLETVSIAIWKPERERGMIHHNYNHNNWQYNNVCTYVYKLCQFRY